jgi:hypothetical protein
VDAFGSGTLFKTDVQVKKYIFFGKRKSGMWGEEERLLESLQI